MTDAELLAAHKSAMRSVEAGRNVPTSPAHAASLNRARAAGLLKLKLDGASFSLTQRGREVLYPVAVLTEASTAAQVRGFHLDADGRVVVGAKLSSSAWCENQSRLDAARYESALARVGEVIAEHRARFRGLLPSERLRLEHLGYSPVDVAVSA